jgi:hypothetical protein
MRGWVAILLAVAVWLMLPLAGCVETRVIGNPKFSDIPGALVGGQPAPPADPYKNVRPAFLVEDRVVEDEEGEVTLYAATVRDMIANILYTLDEDRGDLFAGQILCEETRKEFFERGYDPVTAYDEVKRLERDVRLLFTRLPAGEFTPGVFMRPQGGGYYRIQLRADPERYWRGMDVIYEGTGWKLRWFVQ